MPINSTAERKTKSRAEREADLRAARRAEQATIVSGLKTVLESDEQLLGFARGRIAGGFRGKLNIGPEAFFAPIVNIGLTERRLVLQHIHPENGRPSEILPHFFTLADIASLTFSDVETYGGEPACRLVVHMTNELYCRLRLRGQTNFESAQSIATVFTSLTGPRRSTTTPTQRICSQCTRMLDQPYKFCPYCGQQQPAETHTAEAATEPKAEATAQQPEETPAETSAAPESAPIVAMEEPVTPVEEPQSQIEPSAYWPAEPLAEAEAMPEPPGSESAASDENPSAAENEQNIRYHDDTLSQGEF